MAPSTFKLYDNNIRSFLRKEEPSYEYKNPEQKLDQRLKNFGEYELTELMTYEPCVTNQDEI